MRGGQFALASSSLARRVGAAASSAVPSSSSSASVTTIFSATAQLAAALRGASSLHPSSGGDDAAQVAFDAWTGGGGSNSTSSFRSSSAPVGHRGGGRGRGGRGGRGVGRGGGGRGGGFQSNPTHKLFGDAPGASSAAGGAKPAEPNLSFHSSSEEADDGAADAAGDAAKAARAEEEGRLLLQIDRAGLLLPGSLKAALRHPLSIFPLNPRAPEIPASATKLLHRATAGELFRTRRVSAVFQAVLALKASASANSFGHIFQSRTGDGDGRSQFMAVEVTVSDATALARRGYELLSAGAAAARPVMAPARQPAAAGSSGGSSVEADDLIVGDGGGGGGAAPAEFASAQALRREAPTALLPALTDAGLFLALCACAERSPADLLAAVCYLLGPVSMDAAERNTQHPLVARRAGRSVIAMRMSSDSIATPLTTVLTDVRQAQLPRCPTDWLSLHAVVVAALVLGDAGKTHVPVAAGADATILAVPVAAASASAAAAAAAAVPVAALFSTDPAPSAAPATAATPVVLSGGGAPVVDPTAVRQIGAVVRAVERALSNIFFSALMQVGVGVDVHALDAKWEQDKSKAGALRLEARSTSTKAPADEEEVAKKDDADDVVSDSQAEWLGDVIGESAPTPQRKSGSTASRRGAGTLAPPSLPNLLDEREQRWRPALLAARALPSMLLLRMPVRNMLAWVYVFGRARDWALHYQLRQLLSVFVQDAVRLLASQRAVLLAEKEELRRRERFQGNKGSNNGRGGKPSKKALAREKGLAQLEELLIAARPLLAMEDRSLELQEQITQRARTEMPSVAIRRLSDSIPDFDAQRFPFEFGFGHSDKARREKAKQEREQLQQQQAAGDSSSSALRTPRGSICDLPEAFSGVCFYNYMHLCRSSSGLVLERAGLDKRDKRASSSSSSPASSSSWEQRGRRGSNEASRTPSTAFTLSNISAALKETRRVHGNADADKAMLDLADVALQQLGTDTDTFLRSRAAADCRTLTVRLRDACRLLTLLSGRMGRLLELPQMQALAMRSLDVWCSLQELRVPDWQWVLRGPEVVLLLQRCDHARRSRLGGGGDAGAHEERAPGFASRATGAGMNVDEERVAQAFYGYVRSLSGHTWTAAFGGAPTLEVAPGGASDDPQQQQQQQQQQRRDALATNTWVPKSRQAFVEHHGLSDAERRFEELVMLSRNVRYCSVFARTIDSMLRPLANSGRQPLVTMHSLPPVLLMMEKALEAARAALPALTEAVADAERRLGQAQREGLEMLAAAEAKLAAATAAAAGGADDPLLRDEDDGGDGDAETSATASDAARTRSSIDDGLDTGDVFGEPATADDGKFRGSELARADRCYRAAYFVRGIAYPRAVLRAPHVLVARRMLDAVAALSDTAAAMATKLSLRDSVRQQCVHMLEAAVEFTMQAARVVARVDTPEALELLSGCASNINAIVRMQRRRAVTVVRGSVAYAPTVRRLHLQMLQLISSLVSIETPASILIFDGGFAQPALPAAGTAAPVPSPPADRVQAVAAEMVLAEIDDAGQSHHVQRCADDFQADPRIVQSPLLRAWKSARCLSSKWTASAAAASFADEQRFLDAVTTPSPGVDFNSPNVREYGVVLQALLGCVQHATHHPLAQAVGATARTVLAVRIVTRMSELGFLRGPNKHNSGTGTGSGSGDATRALPSLPYYDSAGCFLGGVFAPALLLVTMSLRSHVCPETALFIAARLTETPPLFVDPRRLSRAETARLLESDAMPKSRVFRVLLSTVVGVLSFHPTEELFLAQRRVALINGTVLQPVHDAMLEKARRQPFSTAPVAAPVLLREPVLEPILGYFETVLANVLCHLLRGETDHSNKMELLGRFVDAHGIMIDADIVESDKLLRNHRRDRRSDPQQARGGANTVDEIAESRRRKALVLAFVATARCLAARTLLQEGKKAELQEKAAAAATSADGGSGAVSEKTEQQRKDGELDDVEGGSGGGGGLQFDAVIAEAPATFRLLAILGHTLEREIGTVRESELDNMRIVEAIDGLAPQHRNAVTRRVLEACLAVEEERAQAEALGGQQQLDAPEGKSRADDGDAAGDGAAVVVEDANARSGEPAPASRAELQLRVEQLVSDCVAGACSSRWNAVLPPEWFGTAAALLPLAGYVPRQGAADAAAPAMDAHAVRAATARIVDAGPVFAALAGGGRDAPGFLAHCSKFPNAPHNGLVKLCHSAFACWADACAALPVSRIDASALEASLRQRADATRVLHDALLVLLCNRVLLPTRLRAVVTALLDELGAALLALKSPHKQRDGNADSAAPAAAAAAALYEYADALVDTLRIVASYWRNGVQIVVDHAVVGRELDFTLLRRIAAGHMLPGTEHAAVQRKRFNLAALSAAHASAREMPVALALSAMPLQKLLVIIETCQRHLRPVLQAAAASAAPAQQAAAAVVFASSSGGGVVGGANAASATTAPSAAMLAASTTAMWLRRPPPAAAELRDRCTFVDDALTVYLEAMIVHNISRSMGALAADFARLVHFAATRFDPAGADAPLQPHEAGRLLFPQLAGHGGAVHVAVTAFDAFRAILCLYAAEQPASNMELLANRYAPALHSIGPAADWELRNFNALLNAADDAAAPAHASLDKIEARYNELLALANTGAEDQPQQQQQQQHDAIRYDGRLDVTATQELNALAALLREARPYTVARVIAERVPAEQLAVIWSCIELCERGRSDDTRRGTRNYHLYAKTVLMCAVNARTVSLEDIAKSLLPVCGFQHRRMHASASMMNANKARMQLSDRMAERAADIVRGW